MLRISLNAIMMVKIFENSLSEGNAPVTETGETIQRIGNPQYTSHKCVD